VPTIKIINKTRIYINSRDHYPMHVHIQHAEKECCIDIITFQLIGDNISNIKEVISWLQNNQKEVIELCKTKVIWG
jgi:hypothetical protein